MGLSSEGNETEYEKRQRFNLLVSWLHSFRYRHILDLIQKVYADDGDATVKIFEIGCAHAKSYAVLSERVYLDYTGVERNAERVRAAKDRYKNRSNFQIVHDSAENQIENITPDHIVVALETLEHIPEHQVVRIVEGIASRKPKLFICSAPVEVGPAVWFKNVGSFITGYMRHEEYTWKETLWAGLGQLDKLPPHGVGHKGFDWRWLAQTIRHNLCIKEIRKFPVNFLPAWCSTSVFIVAQPRDPATFSDKGERDQYTTA